VSARRAARLVAETSAVAAALAAALAGCSGEPRRDPPPAAGAPAATAPAAGAARGGGGGTGGGTAACPHDGRWRACSVVQRLDQAGLVPRVDSEPAAPTPFFGVPATRYLLGRGALQAYVYDDTARLARDLAALDTARVAPRGGSFGWEVPPTFVRSANLVAVLLVQNEHQIERVRLALEAGPPQPDPAAR
jgi:hypothetical protein